MNLKTTFIHFFGLIALLIFMNISLAGGPPAAPPPAPSAWDNFYLSGGVGAASSDVKLLELDPSINNLFFLIGNPRLKDTAFIYQFAFGYDFYGLVAPIRTEFTYSNVGPFNVTQLIPEMGPGGSLIRTFNYRSQLFMWNFYFDLHLAALQFAHNMGLIPFIGGGVGDARNVGSTNHASTEEGDNILNKFAWDVAGGLNLYISHFRVGVLVAYTDLGQINFGQIDGPNGNFPARKVRTEFQAHMTMWSYLAVLSYYFGTAQ